MESKATKKPDYPVIEMKDKGRLILPNHVLAQITYLHGQIGKTEWSGLLFYDVVKGSPAKPEEFALAVKDIFLMDIGSPGFTEYETDGDIVDYYDAKGDEAMEYKMGHIHTHHNMSAFFSGTDNSELQDNVDKHNYYLSLIVNFSGNYVAKVAFLSDVHSSSKMNFIDDAGKKKHFKTDHFEKTMVVIEMDIYYENVDTLLLDRYEAILKKEEEAKAKKEKDRKSFIGKKWDYKLQEWVPINGESQREMFSEDDFKALPSGSSLVRDIDVDPKDMKTMQIEKLARNIFSITHDLSELRSVYQILHQLSEAKVKDLEFYYNFLADNVETVIENYFDVSLEGDEMAIVIEEVRKSLIRFVANPSLKDIVEGISDVLVQFGMNYCKKSEEEQLNDLLEEEALAREIENVK